MVASGMAAALHLVQCAAPVMKCVGVAGLDRDGASVVSYCLRPAANLQHMARGSTWHMAADGTWQQMTWQQMAWQQSMAADDMAADDMAAEHGSRWHMAAEHGSRAWQQSMAAE